MAGRVSSLAKPEGAWWQPLGRDEKLWVGIVVIWGLSMFAMIVMIWPLIGREQNLIGSYRVTPAEFNDRTEAFVTARRVGDVGGVPLVEPEPGGDAYLVAQTFAWRPVLQLRRGQTYRLLISSRDVQHGFSIVMVPRSVNFQILPGYVTEVRLTPEKAGEYPILCNEYCGAGHHLMLGRIVVVD